jgi:hypothetical protein
MNSHERGFRRAAGSSGASRCLRPSRVGLHLRLARCPSSYPHRSVRVSRRCQGISRLALLVGTASEPSRASASAGRLRQVLSYPTSSSSRSFGLVPQASRRQLLLGSFPQAVVVACCKHRMQPVYRPASLAQPNPSLEATRYGRQRLAAPGACAHLPCAASRRLPQRSPQLER